MSIRNRIELIPRNNWDYGFDALFSAFAAMSRNFQVAPNLESIFGNKAVWTNSGRASLYAILKSLELPAGSRVGVPLFCCSVVFNAIHQAGLSPRFIDSNINDCNLSADDLRKKCADLAAVVAVHMFGNPCDMDAILGAAGAVPVIEDCAQSILSTYKGKPTGLLSTASFFSFRCGKYISAGEGSAIFCRDPDLQRRIQQTVNSFESWTRLQMLFNCLSMFAKATMYNRPWYGLIGYPIGMRLDRMLNLTAKDGFEAGKIAPTHLALAEARIPRFQQKVQVQREHAEMLRSALTAGSFGLPSEGADCCSNWFQFALRFQTMAQRDAMADHLRGRGIDTAKYLDTIVQDARSHYGYGGDCPTAELLSKTILLVPIYYTLNTRDLEHIANAINEGSRMISGMEER